MADNKMMIFENEQFGQVQTRNIEGILGLYPLMFAPLPEFPVLL